MGSYHSEEEVERAIRAIIQNKSTQILAITNTLRFYFEEEKRTKETKIMRLFLSYVERNGDLNFFSEFKKLIFLIDTNINDRLIKSHNYLENGQFQYCLTEEDIIARERKIKILCYILYKRYDKNNSFNEVINI